MIRLEKYRAEALAASKASQSQAKRESAKHTPGPWEAVIQPGCHAVIASLSGGPKAVAIIGNNTPDDGNEPMRFANARLIAAAPEMLDALDGLAAQVRPLLTELDIDGFRHSALKEAYDFACKVAGKAQGEPQ